MDQPVDGPVPLPSVVEHATRVVAELLAKGTPRRERALRDVLVDRGQLLREPLHGTPVAAPQGGPDRRGVGREALGRRVREQARGPTHEIGLGRRRVPRKIEAIRRRDVGRVLSRVADQHVALGRHVWLAHEMGDELDVIPREDLGQGLRREVTVRILDLVEVVHPVRRGARTTPHLDDGSAKVAKATARQGGRDRGGETPSEGHPKVGLSSRWRSSPTAGS